MSGFSCNEARRCLDEEATGSLSADQREALEVHLAICEDCRRIQQGWGRVQQTLREAPLEPLPPHVERRLLSGERATRAPRPDTAPATQRWLLPVAAAAAAAVALVFAIPRLVTYLQPEPGPPLASSGAADSGELPDIAPLDPDTRQEVRGAVAGTSLWVQRGARLRVEQNNEQAAHFILDEGFVVAEIGPNEPGYEFVVETPRARLIAHGTVFSLQVSADDGAERYRVAEGIVEVQHKDADRAPNMLGAGLEMTPDARTPAMADVDILRRDLVWIGRDGEEDVPPQPVVAAAPDATALPPVALADVPQAATDAPADDPVAASIDALTRRAQEHLVAREYDAARGAYLELIESHPDSDAAAISRISLGQMELDAVGRPDDALRHFDAYLDRTPSGVLAEEARFGRVRALHEMGRHAAVIDAASEYLEYHPAGSACPQVLRMRADAHRASGSIEEAVLDYEQLIDRWPESPQSRKAEQSLDECQRRR